MKHFSPIEWVDFVRCVATEEQRAAMQDHLDQNCGTCLKMVNSWTTMVEFARCELSHEPPASAVRNAESMFFPFRLALKKRSSVRILSHVFDSYDHGALCEMRSFGIAPHQLMYKYDSVVLDLRVDQQLGSEHMSLRGQVLDAQLTERTFEEIPISLLCKGEEALQTNTNQFGEFSFRFKGTAHLELLINLRDVDLLLLLPERLTGRP